MTKLNMREELTATRFTNANLVKIADLAVEEQVIIEAQHTVSSHI